MSSLAGERWGSTTPLMVSTLVDELERRLEAEAAALLQMRGPDVVETVPGAPEPPD